MQRVLPLRQSADCSAHSVLLTTLSRAGIIFRELTRVEPILSLMRAFWLASTRLCGPRANTRRRTVLDRPSLTPS